MNNTIGKIARRTGVGIETIRFYERKGLIPEPPRDPSSGYRHYPEQTVARLGFIRRAKVLGFTLREIGELLNLRGTDASTCSSFRAHVDEKLVDVRARIVDLQRMEAVLTTLSSACPNSDDIAACPILAALETGDGLEDKEAS